MFNQNTSIWSLRQNFCSQKSILCILAIGLMLVGCEIRRPIEIIGQNETITGVQIGQWTAGGVSQWRSVEKSSLGEFQKIFSSNEFRSAQVSGGKTLAITPPRWLIRTETSKPRELEIEILWSGDLLYNLEVLQFPDSQTLCGLIEHHWDKLGQ